MSKTSLELAISEAAQRFALMVVDAVKGATLQELINLQAGTGVPARRGRGPGRKSIETTEIEAPKKKTGKTKNYPKCAYPKCEKNRFVRGKGFCGDHWRMWLAGKIKSAESYKLAESGTPKKVSKKTAKKVAKKKSSAKK
jgi:hypothetical protein